MGNVVFMKVTISRAKLYPCVARSGPAWRWTYHYSIDGGNPIQYGTRLTSLRGILRKHYPDAEIETSW